MEKKIGICKCFFALLAALFFLQGCGEPQVVRNEAPSKKKEAPDDGFFQYAYKAAPDFYTEMILLKPEGPDADLSRFRFAGAVAFPADPRAAVEYRVHVRTPSGDTVCPSYNGTLPGGRSSLGFECLTAVQSNEVTVELTVAAKGKEHRFEKRYRW